MDMPKLPGPFQVVLDRKTGIPRYYRNKSVRHLSEMRGFFSDDRLVGQMLCRGKNPIIYEVYEIPQPPSEGLFNMACTVLYPGKVGQEYYFTKGHFHSKEPASEVYIGLRGRGLLLLQTRQGEVDHLPLEAGNVVYVPPMWAHRAVNTGVEKMVFLAVYPSDAGHDYESIEREGFAKLVIERGGRPMLVDNPFYKKIKKS
jgi:glucose-6-phosphate isomerase